jgi:hypothetical protein
MPLYEILLNHNGTHELRLADQPYTVGEVVEIGGVTWTVIRVEPPHSRAAESLFVLEQLQARPSLGTG